MPADTLNIAIRAADRTGRAWASANRGATGFGGKLKAVGIGFGALGTAAAGAFGKITKDLVIAGDEIDKTSRRIGISAEATQRLGHSADLAGADLGTVEKGMRRMASSIADANDGLAESVRAFDGVGVSLDDLAGLNPEEQFLLIADALRQVTDESEQSALAQDLFGRAGANLLPLVETGSAAIRAQGDELDRLGGLMSDEFVRDSALTVDAMSRAKLAFQGALSRGVEPLLEKLPPLIDQFAARLGPALESFASGGSSAAIIALEDLGKTMDNAGAFARDVLIPAAGALNDVLEPLGVGVVDLSIAIRGVTLAMAGNPFGAVAVALLLLVRHWDEVKNAINSVVDDIDVKFVRPVKDAVGEVVETLNILPGVSIGVAEESGKAMTNLEKLTAEVGAEAAASIRDSTDSAIRHVQTGIDAMHYAGTRQLANFEAANEASAATTAEEWELAYGAITKAGSDLVWANADFASDLAWQHVTAAGLSAQAWEDAYRTISPERGEQLGQVNRFKTIAELRATVTSPTDDDDRPPWVPSQVEDEKTQTILDEMVKRLSEFAHLSSEEAAAALIAQYDLTQAFIDADGHRSIADLNLLSAAADQVEALGRVEGIGEETNRILEQFLIQIGRMADPDDDEPAPSPDSYPGGPDGQPNPWGGRYEWDRQPLYSNYLDGRGLVPHEGPRQAPTQVEVRLEIDGAEFDARVQQAVVDGQRVGAI